MAQADGGVDDWRAVGGRFECPTGRDVRVEVTPHPFSLRITAGDKNLVATAGGSAFPDAAVAVRRDARWHVPTGEPTARRQPAALHLAWGNAITVILSIAEAGDLDFQILAPGADAVSLGLESRNDEHYYGLGERFNKLDRRGEIVDLWVKNGASGGDTYKPVPFLVSSLCYGLLLDTSYRVHCTLAHPTCPWLAGLVVHTSEMRGTIIPGPTMSSILERYTARIGRPPIPPDWVFQPWKAGDWRTETEQSVLQDIKQQQERKLPCGVKLIDAGWETELHSFAFDPLKYPDPPALLRTARAAGQQVVLWISPGMAAGSAAYEEAAARGYLIRDDEGHPYLHRLGNDPGWLGTLVDFTNPAALSWWQERLRLLLELGVRGFKTDFGEQVPVDARFSDGRTGAELHNLYPVLYNRATWDVVREYQGVLLARSAWAGSQRFPGIWAGDQSADFSPWAGLPTAIVAGQSAGWSGFPYWGCDVGGYFGTPDDECFVRWTQFAALTPIMEVHGLGVREPWLFSPSTLEVYRRYAQLHAQLIPYTLAMARQASDTGLPLMRAMALAFPDDPGVYDDWVQYQYLYGADLLVAPVYAHGRAREVHFPAGTWIDFFDGKEYAGPCRARLAAPLETLPLFVRVGAVLPLLADPWTPADRALLLQLYPGAAGSATQILPDGTEIVFTAGSDGESTVRVRGPARDYTLRAPFRRITGASLADHELLLGEGGVSWTGDAVLTLRLEPDAQLG